MLRYVFQFKILHVEIFSSENKTHWETLSPSEIPNMGHGSVTIPFLSQDWTIFYFLQDSRIRLFTKCFFFGKDQFFHRISAFHDSLSRLWPWKTIKLTIGLLRGRYPLQTKAPCLLITWRFRQFHWYLFRYQWIINSIFSSKKQLGSSFR